MRTGGLHSGHGLHCLQARAAIALCNGLTAHKRVHQCKRQPSSIPRGRLQRRKLQRQGPAGVRESNADSSTLMEKRRQRSNVMYLELRVRAVSAALRRAPNVHFAVAHRPFVGGQSRYCFTLNLSCCILIAN